VEVFETSGSVYSKLNLMSDEFHGLIFVATDLGKLDQGLEDVARKKGRGYILGDDSFDGDGPDDT